jgi:hypothetical protein
VQAILTVIGRRRFGAKTEGSDRRVDLSSAYLPAADLRGAHLEGAVLIEAHLEGARDLSVEMVKSALGWEHAYYNAEFRKKLFGPEPSVAS